MYQFAIEFENTEYTAQFNSVVVLDMLCHLMSMLKEQKQAECDSTESKNMRRYKLESVTMTII